MSAEVPASPDSAASPDGAPPQKIGCLARLIPVTPPGCASCLTSLFLFITVIAVWTIFWLDPANVPWRHAMTFWRYGSIIALIVVIPLVLYKTLQWWLEGESSPFPDVEYAWNAGVQACVANGISLSTTPIYVVLGSNSDVQERSLLTAAGIRLRVEGVPAGPSPIRWYANSDAIYLFCSDASWTSAIASLREELAVDAAARGAPPPEGAPNPLESGSPGDAGMSGPAAWSVAPATGPANVPGAGGAAPPAAGGGSESFRGTLMLDQFLSQSRGADGPPQPPAAAPQGRSQSPVTSFRGTMDLSAPIVADPRRSASSDNGPTNWSGSDASTPSSTPEPVLVSSQYSAVCLQQLNHVGELLRRGRRPICGLNGILVLLQYEAIYSTPAEIDELEKSLRSDLATLEYSTQVRCPVTALVVGLEKERGFRELVRRVGKDRAMSQRFGRKFDVRFAPTNEDLTALSAHVCGAFEDWAYALFREEESLTRPGNTRLYELLSKVRCNWKVRLGEVLAGGFGCDLTPEAQNRSHLFSGCYVAATGESPDRQAFVKGVFDKLKEEQEFIEWTADALAEQDRVRRLAKIGLVIAGLLFATLVGLIGYKIWDDRAKESRAKSSAVSLFQAFDQGAVDRPTNIDSYSDRSLPQRTES